MITLPELCPAPTEIDMFVRQLASRALERSIAPAVDAMVIGGYLTLTGSVDSALAKADAERTVASVPGVRGVMNRIRVDKPRGAKAFRWGIGRLAVIT